MRFGSAALVEAAEQKLRGESLTPAAITEAIEGLFGAPGGARSMWWRSPARIFRLLAHELAAAAPRPCVWLDSGEAIARRVAHVLDAPKQGARPRAARGFHRAQMARAHALRRSQARGFVTVRAHRPMRQVLTLSSLARAPTFRQRGISETLPESASSYSHRAHCAHCQPAQRFLTKQDNFGGEEIHGRRLLATLPSDLTSQILNIAAVLTRKRLKVPRYQRPYTWTEREVRQLIQDLRRAYKRGASFYFIGQIVLVKNHGKLEISDGQQRLATLTMLIAYVRDRLPGRAKRVSAIDHGRRSRRGSLLREEDARTFICGYRARAGTHAPNWRATPKSAWIPRICSRRRRRRSSPNCARSRRIANSMRSCLIVARCCTLNVVDADERGCAQTVFNTLNKRGSPLSGADIIKSDLMENSGLSQRRSRRRRAQMGADRGHVRAREFRPACFT